MQTTLYNHDVDTIDLSVDSPIDFSLILEILPDLEKAYHVKTNIYYDYTTLGDVICAFMNAQYAGCSGEIYDYYKIRYSSRPAYYQYLEKYPNSPFAEEVRLKMECVSQNRAWGKCDIMEDFVAVYNLYGPSYCPYGGFSNIAKRNNNLREYMALYIDYYSSFTDDDKGLSFQGPYEQIIEEADAGYYNLTDDYNNILINAIMNQFEIIDNQYNKNRSFGKSSNFN